MVCRRHLLLRGQKGLALDMSMWIRLFSRNQSVIGKYFIPVIVISSVLVVQHHPIRWLTVCRRRRYILWCCSVLLYLLVLVGSFLSVLICKEGSSLDTDSTPFVFSSFSSSFPTLRRTRYFAYFPLLSQLMAPAWLHPGWVYLLLHPLHRQRDSQT